MQALAVLSQHTIRWKYGEAGSCTCMQFVYSIPLDGSMVKLDHVHACNLCTLYVQPVMVKLKSSPEYAWLWPTSLASADCS